MDFRSPTAYDLHLLVKQVSARRIPQFDIVISRRQVEMLELACEAGITAIDVDAGFFHVSDEFDFTRLGVWHYVRGAPGRVVAIIAVPTGSKTIIGRYNHPAWNRPDHKPLCPRWLRH